MPVTRTAKRALRSSKRKELVNKLYVNKLEIAIRTAKKSKKEADVKNAVSLTDRLVKKGNIHKNKAARVKSQLSKLLGSEKTKAATPKKPSKKK